VSLGVALGGHVHPFEELLDLVRLAESLGYRAAYVDGDVSMLPSRGEADVLDGWTVTTALLLQTRRIEIGSIRLVHHWPAARLAQAVVSLERIVPGRLRFFVSIGDQEADRRFGLSLPPAADRIRWLDETLAAVRALWAGKTVTCRGEFVRLDGARVRPIPRGGAMPIEIAARRPRLLEIVARHADRWDVNLPPIRSRVEAAAARLAEACRAEGRDPTRIERSMWIFTRPGADSDDPELARQFRSRNPWFRDLGPGELGEAILAGPAEACRRRIEAIRCDLAIDLPVLDLTGLDGASTRRVMETLAPREGCVDAVRPSA
jgi:alkanesulfonate monooxygenase SsuD/methylene tetrahydromethanopterin reductase-like flavin-dependent oxidoreductase (luciferase family)